MAPAPMFNDRLAALEEHLVSPTADDHIDKAEQYLAAGQDVWARLELEMAKLTVARVPTPEEFLSRAEKALARGDESEARHCLNMARIHRSCARIEAITSEWDEADDGA
jgi:hypothetical protein